MVSNKILLQFNWKWILIVVASGTFVTLGGFGVALFYKFDFFSNEHNNTNSTMTTTISTTASVTEVSTLPTISNSPKLYDSNNKFPYMALLYLHHDNNITLCGGTLIDETRILTAAHCVYGAHSAEILLGADNLFNEQNTKTFESRCFVIHENYDNVTHANDIALVYIKGKVTPSSYINPVKLFEVSDLHLFYESPQYVLGWGLKNSEEGLDSNLKNKSVQIVNSRLCSSSTEEDYSIICAKSLSPDGPCHGDSGGPLLRDQKSQVGIVSVGDTSCNLSNPTVFTAVRFYMSWINANRIGRCKLMN